MGIREIKDRYGASEGRTALNRAIRAEIPGGAELLDAIHVLCEYADGGERSLLRAGAVMRNALTLINKGADRMRDKLLAESDDPAAKLDRKVSIHAPEGAIGDPNQSQSDMISIHADEAATPELSLDLLKKSSTPGDVNWTPPAALVEQFGHLSVKELSRLSGKSEAAIREAHRRLNVEPYRERPASAGHHDLPPALVAQFGKTPIPDLARSSGLAETVIREAHERRGIAPARTRPRWTAQEDRIVRSMSPAAAAAKLGRPLNAVKIRKSRLAAKTKTKDSEDA